VASHEGVGVRVAPQLGAEPREGLVERPRRSADVALDAHRTVVGGLLALRETVGLVPDERVAEQGADADQLRRAGRGRGLERRPCLHEAGRPVADHLERREHDREVLLLVVHGVVEGQLERVEDLVLGDQVGEGAAIRVECRVEMAFDEPGMDRPTARVDRALRATSGRHLGIATDGHDVTPPDRDRAILDEAALVVHRQEVAVPDQQVDVVARSRRLVHGPSDPRSPGVTAQTWADEVAHPRRTCIVRSKPSPSSSRTSALMTSPSPALASIRMRSPR
jgi:hypothetical protein